MDASPLKDYLGRSSSTADVEETKSGSFVRNDAAACLMLDLVLRGGERVALPYCFLDSIKLDPSGEIKMVMSEHQITITGRNLTPLHNALLAHLVHRVWESEDDFDDKSKTTWIHRIRVKSPNNTSLQTSMK